MHKINIFQIVVDHFGTLKVAGRQALSIFDLFVFFVLPAMFSFALYHFNVTVSDRILEQFSVGFSIIFGFLLNVQVLIFSIGKRHADSDRLKLLKETFANVSFAILVSLLVLSMSIILLFFDSESMTRIWAGYVLFYLLGVLLFTIIMIFKRVHISLSKEMEG